MWIILTVPVMVLGVTIAVLPVAWGSLHFHGVEHHEHVAATTRAADSAAAGQAVAVAAPLAVDCPLCSTAIEGTTQDRLVDAVHRHAWRVHGIPSARHIMESAALA